MALVSLWVLLGCVLGVLNLCSPASGFARCVTIKAPSSAHRGRDKSTALRLAAQQEQQGKDDTTASSTNVSEFEQTSGPVKAFVGGLTDLFVLISGGNEEEALAAAAPKVRHTSTYDAPSTGRSIGTWYLVSFSNDQFRYQPTKTCLGRRRNAAGAFDELLCILRPACFFSKRPATMQYPFRQQINYCGAPFSMPFVMAKNLRVGVNCKP